MFLHKMSENPEKCSLYFPTVTFKVLVLCDHQNSKTLSYYYIIYLLLYLTKKSNKSSNLRNWNQRMFCISAQTEWSDHWSTICSLISYSFTLSVSYLRLPTPKVQGCVLLAATVSWVKYWHSPRRWVTLPLSKPAPCCCIPAKLSKTLILYHI